MPWAAIFLSIVFLFACGAFVMARRRAAARNAIAWLRLKYGHDISLLSVCLILSGRKRVPGAVALTGNAMVWRSLRFNKSMLGEIPLSDVVFFMWCEAARGAHPAVRRRHPGNVLTVKTRDGLETSLMLDRTQYPIWEKVLEARLSDRGEDPGVDSPVEEDIHANPENPICAN